MLGFTDHVHVWAASISASVVFPIQGPYGDPLLQGASDLTNPFEFFTYTGGVNQLTIQVRQCWR
jgi:hypothetical protein